MIDSDGYRPNVGIVIVNQSDQIFLAKRIGQDAWQLPQGGIDENESELEALYRELFEEVGLLPEHIELIAKTPKWLRYELPKKHQRRFQNPKCVGQKQVWYLVKLKESEDNICLDHHDEVEFDDWRWVDFWDPVDLVIEFKRSIYEDMLKAFAPVLFNNKHHVPAKFNRPLKCSAISLLS